ncbi:MAG: ReoY family proteolytic degradation factor [Anaerobacillus sp.]|uniref:ReoY family proteolytic degradation factor n=1 Tax=Anaerobacillus sp. TaxID=1872506 RepID=UPI00391A20CC
MSSTISVLEKKDFLKWFLNNYQLKRRECAWLLNYLMSDDDLMEKVHFVESAEYCPKSLIISANDVDSIPFSFQKRQHVTMDAEKSFHDIRLNKEEEIYIQLNFKDAKKNPQYVSVLEDNPFIPIDKDTEKLFSLFADLIIDQAKYQFEKKRLLQLIDEALDTGDKDNFLKYSEMLRNLKALKE